jgi:predicted membrane protein
MCICGIVFVLILILLIFYNQHSIVNVRGAFVLWLKVLQPLNPGIVGSSLIWVATIFPHMTQVLVSSRKRTHNGVFIHDVLTNVKRYY